MVADGEWRDYAIDFLRDRAVFSVFRRASEVPIYRIEKDPRLVRKQGIYSVISASGLILRRGHELDRVLLVIDRKAGAGLAPTMSSFRTSAQRWIGNPEVRETQTCRASFRVRSSSAPECRS